MIGYAARRCGQALLTCAGLLLVAAFLAGGGEAVDWPGSALRLDFGRTTDGGSVAAATAAALPASALLAGASLAITLLLGWGGGLLLGMARADGTPRHGPRRATRAIGAGLAAVAAMAQALPVFWMGALLIAGCSIGTGWLPPGGIASPDLPAFGTGAYRLLLESQPAIVIPDLLAHLALPALTLALVGIATGHHLIGAELPDELRSPHATVARATGMPRRRLLRRAARPVLPVALAGSAASLPSAISALVLVEYLFGWPGIGLLAYRAAREGDMATLAALLLLVGLLTIGIDLMADLLSAWADPRLRTREPSR